MEELEIKLEENFSLEEFRACRERISAEIGAINTLEATLSPCCWRNSCSRVIAEYSFLSCGLLACNRVWTYGLWRYNAPRKVIRIHEAYILDEIERNVRSNNLGTLKGMMTYYEENNPNR